MDNTFNYAMLFAIGYILIIIITTGHVYWKHDWLDSVSIILGVFWPIYWVAYILLILIEKYNDYKEYHKIKKRGVNFFSKTLEGQIFQQSSNFPNQLRKSSIKRTKRLHAVRPKRC